MIITVHALGTYVAPENIFTYGISTIHDSDIRYAREKNVKIKLVAQVVKVSDEHFTMFVMPEFVTPSKYIYSVDDEYNGVVIRGECYDRQFMFGKGAGSLPTASSILSDIMARLNNYRYEYKKQNYMQKPDYTTDITLKVYVRYKETDVHGILNFYEGARTVHQRRQQLRHRRHPAERTARQTRPAPGKGRVPGQHPDFLPEPRQLTRRGHWAPAGWDTHSLRHQKVITQWPVLPQPRGKPHGGLPQEGKTRSKKTIPGSSETGDRSVAASSATAIYPSRSAAKHRFRPETEQARLRYRQTNKAWLDNSHRYLLRYSSSDTPSFP